MNNIKKSNDTSLSTRKRLLVHHASRIGAVGGTVSRIITGLALLLISMVTLGQTTSGPQTPYEQPQTPNVAAFMKNIDHPVGLYHGNPEISHTLYTLKDGAITLPITLNYNASGIKVNEEASWVGLGWNLQMGGMVVQSPVGVSDNYGDQRLDAVGDSIQSIYAEPLELESFKTTPIFYYTNIYCNTNPPTPSNPTPPADVDKYYNFYKYGPQGYYEPDVYYFVYPGGSGKFYIDPTDNNSIHLLDDNKNIKITKGSDGGWEITTEKGIVHKFSIKTSRSTVGNPYTIASVYYLSSSVYPNGQEVTYNYVLNNISTVTPDEVRRLILKIADGGVAPNATGQNTYNDGGTTHVLSVEDENLFNSIVTTNYTITFYRSSRNDLYNGQKLDEIKIRSNQNSSSLNNISKDFKFTYDYFVSPTTGNGWSLDGQGYSSLVNYNDKRLKLLNVYETDGNSNKNTLLSFDYYDSMSLPVKNSYAVDYWGYYNGQTSNTSLIPDFRYLFTDTQTRPAWINDLSKNKSTAIRAYNFNTCIADMLKRVNYPMGGYMEYTYEPHEYQDLTLVPTVDEIKDLNTLLQPPYRHFNYGGGVRVKDVTYHDGISSSRDYSVNYSYPNPELNAISFTPLTFSKEYDDLDYAQIPTLPYSGQSAFFGSNGSELDMSGSNFASAPYSEYGTIAYSEVHEEMTGAGSTVYKFVNRKPYYNSMSFQIPDYLDGMAGVNGSITSIASFDVNNNMEKEEFYDYTTSLTHHYWGISMEDKFNRSPNFYGNLVWQPYTGYPSRFTTLAYPVNSFRNLLTSKTITEDGVTTIHNYTYDDGVQVVRDDETRSDGMNQATTYTYPYDYTVEPYKAMAERHELAYPVEVKQSVDGATVESKLTQYANFGSMQLPSSVSKGVFPTSVADNATFTNSGANSTTYPYADATFLKYDGFGNPVDLLDKGEEVVLIWSYNGQFPVAEIKGSTYAAVQAALGMAPESYSPTAVPDASKMNALRTAMPNALVTTYTFQPLAGLTSVTAPDGTTTTYDYDTFGRLIDTKDTEGNIVAANDYHYQGSTNPSTLPGTGTTTPVTPPINDNSIIGKVTWSSSVGSMGFGFLFQQPVTGDVAVNFSVRTTNGNLLHETINIYKGSTGTGTSFPIPGEQAVEVSGLSITKLDSNDKSTYLVYAVKNGDTTPYNITGKMTWGSSTGSMSYTMVFPEKILGSIAVDFYMTTSNGETIPESVSFPQGFSGTGNSISVPNDMIVTDVTITGIRKLNPQDPATYTVTVTGSSGTPTSPVTPPTPPVDNSNITGKLTWSANSTSIGFSLVFSTNTTGDIAIDISAMTSSGSPVAKTLTFSKGFSGTGTSFALPPGLPSGTQVVALSCVIRKLDTADASSYTLTVVGPTGTATSTCTAK